MENERLAEKALKILCERSAKARELTKKAILKEKMSKKAVEALKYYVKKWNDTTRPGVLSLACEAVGGSSEEIIPLQVALLSIAGWMDIHDDIIDKSATKNSEQTLYGKFGEETALLLGDAFLVKSFNQLCNAIENLPNDRKSLIINTAKDFLFEVIDAHIIETKLKNDKWNVRPEQYLHVLEKKAADIEGHMRIGAIFGGGSSQEIEVLSNYGRNLGVLLAVRSDFIDVFEPSELASRVKYECLPLPILYALQSNIHMKKIRRILLDWNINKNNVDELIEIIYDTVGMYQLRALLKELKNEAIIALNRLRENQAKKDLQLLISAMIEDL